ncbi:DUF1217 domain-containing protein [Paracoccus laeviglucosivorans]|uniref:Flagellar protein n=1 Tax=Paracoccus laeviglucosivorans TaxID=1197861 RepID=A0A521F731_9RHOB|nr:DUF1217 domain-containing protein [Paracoccus laeviglucosivorans]SMO92008.1 Protein of unknown function [Paracoccus laeviglucosivorans]
MSYLVQAGSGGYLGWKFLERTADTQRITFEKGAQIQRSRDYFSEKMPNVKQADELVSDYRLLQVALRAFGLDGDINNRLFIRKILESDPNDETSLVNKLSDKRYLSLNKAFGLSEAGTADPNKAPDVNEILDLYVTRSFEKNIGERYQEIELGLNARRELPILAASTSSENTKWYQILGSKPLRKVFEGAFGMSASFGQLPIDRQVEEMKTRLERMTGSADISQFTAPEMAEALLKNYLLRSQISSISISSPYAAALTILRGGR